MCDEQRMNGKDWAALKARSMRRRAPPRSDNQGQECEYNSHMELVTALECLAAHVPMEAEAALWTVVNHLR